jgi:predicted transcriptional regulator
MNTAVTSTAAPVRSTFIRFLDTKYVKSLIKEAKNVKYTVNISRNGDNVYLYEVFDPEQITKRNTESVWLNLNDIKKWFKKFTNV